MPLHAPHDGAGAPASVRVGRQGIFDRDRGLVGYELLFRAAGADAANLTTEGQRDAATSQVLSAALGDLSAHMPRTDGMRLFVNLTRAFVLGDLPLVDGPEGLVLEVTEDIQVDEDVLAGLRRLRARGYELAVDDYEGEEHRLPSLALASYVKVVLDPQRPEDLARLVEHVRAVAPHARVVVERVETQADLRRCADLGVDLFQGYWLQRPQVLSAPTIDPGRMAALRLLLALADPETSTRELARLVMADAGLSLKVLRVASSSAVATREPITSVPQAVVLLGRRVLSAWAALTVVGASATNPSGRTTMAFVLARAGACARLVPQEAQEAYTVGLLSGTADALGVSIDDLLVGLSVHEQLSAALRRFEGPAGGALAAVLAGEPGTGAVPEEDVALPSGSPSPVEASAAYASALGEAVALSQSLLD